jgi:hypothetical protein
VDDPEVEDLILEAWERVRPKLESDPVELAKRLKRIHGASLSRPPRPWCLCVRACDRRIDTWLGFESATRDGPGKHEVMLDAPLVRRLCAPITVPSRVSARELAEMLGRCPEDLYPTRSKGKFAVDHVAGLGGNWGKPMPLLSCKEELDPSASGFEMPDRVWGDSAVYSDRRMRDEFEQVVERVPVYLDRNRRYRRDKSELHPEHPDVDGGTRKQVRYTLPPVLPDPVWYKWKGDEYIGYDWRMAEKNPIFRENYERHERRKARDREYEKRRRREGKLRPSKQYRSPYGGGSLMFRGWRWRCPGCEALVKTLYLPMAFYNALDGLMGDAIEREVVANLPAVPVKRYGRGGGFACKDCYHVRNFSRDNHNFWNAVVGYLTGGLMYGYEVEKPPWLTRDRKRAYTPRATVRPAWRREQVRELLERGKSYKEIAQELAMKVQTVYVHAQRVKRMKRINIEHPTSNIEC